jgi:hypothetical protein
MGQYFIVANLDKRQCLHPRTFDDGRKLLELYHTLTALALLMADNGEHPWRDCPLHGTWAGDRIVFAGDYGDNYADVEDFEDIGNQLSEYVREA